MSPTQALTIVVAALSFGLLTTGCSSDDPTAAACIAVNQKAWKPPAGGDKQLRRIAEALDVDVDQVSAGSSGILRCDRTVRVSNTVQVAGKQTKCYVTGMADPKQGTVRSEHVVGACPASAG